MIEFPTTLWIKQQLRYNLIKPIRPQIIELYVIGSYARGNFHSHSDLDIAVVIQTKKRISSIGFSEKYHANFVNDHFKPKWKGVIVDFQFFYPDEIDNFVKIEIL
jgi:predicted nucleotidyltransferase